MTNKDAMLLVLKMADSLYDRHTHQHIEKYNLEISEAQKEAIEKATAYIEEMED